MRAIALFGAVIVVVVWGLLARSRATTHLPALHAANVPPGWGAPPGYPPPPPPGGHQWQPPNGPPPEPPAPPSEPPPKPGVCDGLCNGCDCSGVDCSGSDCNDLCDIAGCLCELLSVFDLASTKVLLRSFLVLLTPALVMLIWRSRLVARSV